MSKMVTVRTTGNPSTEVLTGIIARVQGWNWDGETAVPVRIEYAIGRGTVHHFPFGEVPFSRASADALLATLDQVDAIICSTPREQVPKVELKRVRVPRK